MKLLKNEEIRRFRYIETLGKVSGRWLYLLEQLGFRHTLAIRFGADKIQFRLNSSDIDVLYTIFIRQDYKMSLQTSPAIIIDAGAYVGYSSIYFAQQYPDARIIAIEPVPSNYAILKKNIARYPHIFAVQKAVWFEETKVELVDRKTGYWGYSINYNSNSTLREVIFVDAISINKIIADLDIDTIDLLKIDIEGAEKEVFEHSQNWIGKVNAVAVELHDRIKDGCSRNFEAATRDFTFERRNSMTVFKSRHAPV